MGLSLILSLGSGWYGEIPLMSLLRVPSRFLFLFDFSISMILGFGVDALVRGKITGIIFKPASWLAATAVGSLAIGLALTVWISSGLLPVELLWGLVLFTASLGFLGLIRYAHIRSRVIIIGITLILGVDLGVAGNSQLRWVKLDVEDTKQLRIVILMNNLLSPERIYSPSYQISQLTSERMDLEMISGIDPMQLAHFVSYFSDATNIPVNEYSIPIPPLNDEPVGESNKGILPNAEKLGWMNVGWMVTGENFENPEGWELVSHADGKYIYKNLLIRPRAWVQVSSDKIDTEFSEAIITQFSPNKIEVKAQGPGTLILAEVVYPGWKAKVDGLTVPIGEISGLLRSVQLDTGQHQIEFSYWPHWITVGFMAQFSGLLLIVFLIRRKEKS